MNTDKKILKYQNIPLIHHCEKCGFEEVLTLKEAFDKGWDGPYMYSFAVISPRTCPNCTIENTAWAALNLEGKTYDQLTPVQKEALDRILNEPTSMLPQ